MYVCAINIRRYTFNYALYRNNIVKLSKFYTEIIELNFQIQVNLDNVWVSHLLSVICVVYQSSREIHWNLRISLFYNNEKMKIILLIIYKYQHPISSGQIKIIFINIKNKK